MKLFDLLVEREDLGAVESPYFFVSIEKKLAEMWVGFKHNRKIVYLWHRVFPVHWTVQNERDLPDTIGEVLKEIATEIPAEENPSQDTLDWEQTVLINQKILELVQEIPYPQVLSYGNVATLSFRDTLEQHLLLGGLVHDFQCPVEGSHITTLVKLREISPAALWEKVHDKYRWRDLATSIEKSERG